MSDHNELPQAEAQWREKLTPEQYHICREGGTERAFTGRYYHNAEAGEYRCICCGQTLFKSEQKYDSGSGWPSFWQPAGKGLIDERLDRGHGMIRTEVRCKRCDSHLGHLFTDGPQPTGLRYCVNSASLEFKKREDQD